MTHSCVWHDSFMCVTWLIHVCDMTHSDAKALLRHGSISLLGHESVYSLSLYSLSVYSSHSKIGLPCRGLAHTYPVVWCMCVQLCVSSVHVCDRARLDTLYVTWHIDMWRDTLTCATWHIHVCDRSHKRGHTIYMCDVTRIYMGHASLTYGTWLFQVCDMTYRKGHINLHAWWDTLICAMWFVDIWVM